MDEAAATGRSRRLHPQGTQLPSQHHRWDPLPLTRANSTIRNGPPTRSAPRRGCLAAPGSWTFADDEAFSERRAVDPSTGFSTFAHASFRGRKFALFIQDNWKVRPHVALTLGLRHEVFLSPRKVADNVQRDSPRSGHDAAGIRSGMPGSERSIVLIDTD
jgi:hypothetical protein